MLNQTISCFQNAIFHRSRYPSEQRLRFAIVSIATIPRRAGRNKATTRTSKFGNSLRGTFCESVGLFVRRIFAMPIIATGPWSHVAMNFCPLAFVLLMARVSKSARSRTSTTPRMETCQDTCGHPDMFPFIIFLIIWKDEEKLELMTGPKIPVGLITANSRLPPSSLQNFQADSSASVLLLWYAGTEILPFKTDQCFSSNSGNCSCP